MYNSMESGDVQPAVENNKMVKPMFQGETFASKIVDAFVVMHFIFAFIFASLACFYPSIFSLFANESTSFDEGTYAADAVRWSSPFIFGFSFFAFNSLYIDAVNRRAYAKVYTLSFTIATIIGFITQFNGRWNEYHSLNIVLFGSLAIGYGILLSCFSDGFDREKSSKDM